MGLTGRIKTTELQAHVDEQVTVAGWLHHRRRLGALTFIVVRDGWGLCQAVVEGEEPLAGVPCESIVQVSGKVVPAPQAPGGIEIRACEWHVMSKAEQPPVSLGKKELHLSLSTCLDFAALALRHPSRREVFRMSAGIMAAFRSTLGTMGFTEIVTPKVVGGASEGGANVFRLDYFGRPAFLAQSPQLYKQIMVGVFERVFEVGPVFRAEPHDTVRHLNQYTSLDAEMGFIKNHHDVMTVVEEVVCRMVEEGSREIMAGDHSSTWQAPRITRPFPSVPFWEAQELIFHTYGRDVRGEEDLSPQDERDLGAWARQTYGSDFLFVTGYPRSKRPFYTYPDPAHPEFTNSFDLLFRGLEIVTGGQRLHRYEDYVTAIRARHMSAEPLAGYLLASRHGMPPHGGFGMGLKRFVSQLLGFANVREATLFPRDINRLEP